MNITNAAIDQANELADRERENGIKAASKALLQQGTTICIRCEEPISERRMKHLPSATRCVECQTIHEKEQAAR